MTFAASIQFSCNSCQVSIESIHPRIHCLVCHDLNLCANCAIGEKLPSGHFDWHAIEVYRESGDSSDGAVLSQVTISYTSRSSKIKQPVDLKSIQSRCSSPPPNLACPDPTSLVPTKIASQQEIPLTQSGWEPFFLPDMTPTLTYMTLANEIFTYLDPRNSGILIPETLSRFLDDMGYLPDENYWKNGSKASLETNNPDMSILSNRDKALKHILELFSIEHHLLPRPSAPQCLPTMPAITRKGFIAVTSIDLLLEPSQQWEQMNGVLRKYNLPSHQRWGDLPRSVLPPVPEQAMLYKVMTTAAIAKQKTSKDNGVFPLSEEQLQMELRMIDLQSRSSIHTTDQSFLDHRFYS